MSRQQRGLRLLTLNVNGLGSPRRARALLHYLCTVCRSPDVVLLQELKVRDTPALTAALTAGRGQGIPYHAVCYDKCGTDHSCGVAILINLNGFVSHLPDSPSAVDADGRVVRVDASFCNQPLSILSVYAPNTSRVAFFNNLRNFLPSNRLCIVGGDFNCILDPQDQTNNGQARLAGGAALGALMQDYELHDVFRRLHPSGNEFTHVDTHRHSAARLDRFLASSACVSWVHAVRHEWGAPGDHAAVLMDMCIPGRPTMGPGLLSFPSFVLFHDEYRHALEAELTTKIANLASADASVPGSAWARWEHIKAHTLDVGQRLGAQHIRKQLADLQPALQSLTMASHRLAAEPQSTAARQGLLTASRNLRGAVYAQSNRLATASAAIWRDYGEKPTAWHFAQSGPPHKRGAITALRDGSGTVHDMTSVQSGVDLSDLVNEYFSSTSPTGLFRAGEVDLNAQQELLVGLDSLSAAQARVADGPNEDGSITAACVLSALKATSAGKAPGRDGLPYEVYKQLWGVLGAPLVAALDDIHCNGPQPGSSWAEGIIIPIYKGKQLPTDRLSSYRPITLLNTDNKLAQRVISDRLQQPLSFLVSPAQTAFISGRSIADNVLLTQCLAEYLEEEQQPGVMVVLDIKQAYDRVDRGWVHDVAAAMQLPAGLRTWIQRFMQSCSARVLINGHTTPAFPVDNGLPQGGPLAPPLWTLQLQPLTAALQRAQDVGQLHSPLLPDGTQVRPISHHADDSKLFLRSLHVDGPAAMHIIQKYCSASNALMHDDKAQGHCMGSHPSIAGQDPVTRAHFGLPGDPPMVSLGVPVTTNMELAHQHVYQSRVQAINGVAARWRDIPLSMVGRILNAKQQMANMLCYHVSFVPPDSVTVASLQRTITQYVARSQQPEDLTLSSRGSLQLLPKQAISCLPRHHGGLAFPDVPSQIVSLQAKITAAAFSPGAAQWKSLMLRALARAAPHPGWGPVWIFLPTLPMTGMAAVPPRVQCLLRAFRASLPAPVLGPSAACLPLRACLLQPMFHNPGLTDPVGAVFALPDQVPDGWPFLLGQLLACPPALRSDSRIQAVEACLPARWRQALQAQAAGESALEEHDYWWMDVVTSTVVQLSTRRQVQGVYRSLPSGVLLPVHPAPTVLPPLVPACVLSVPKPRRLWSPDELADYEAAPHAERHLRRPTEPRLLAPWSVVKVFPGAWVHCSVPLHQFSCAAVRMHLTASAAASAVLDRMPDYTVGSALRPRLWPSPQPTRRAAGLQGVEQEWLQAHNDHHRYSAPSASPARPHPSAAWLARRPLHLRAPAGPAAAATAGQPATTPRSPPSPSPPPAASAAGSAAVPSSPLGAGPSSSQAGAPPAPARAGQAAPSAHSEPNLPSGAAASGSGDDAQALASDSGQGPPVPTVGGPGPHTLGGGPHAPSAKYWSTLWSLPVCNHVKVFGLRLAHAALPCRAMVAGMRRQPSRSSVNCPSCMALTPRPSPVPAETYTHLFLLCPTYRPVVSWLLNVWERLTGVRPPMDPAVIVAAQPSSWPAGPGGNRLLAWHALRLTVLYSIWCARSSGVPTQCCPSAVARSVVASLREEIALQFRRRRQRQYNLQFLPPRLLGTHRLRPADEGFAVWLDLGLCTVLGASSSTSPGGAGHLVILLSDVYPVPLPADP